MGTSELVHRTLMASFAGPVAPDWFLKRIERGLGGVCLFGSNLGRGDRVRELTDVLHAARPDVVVATDEEGGDVTRLEATVGSSSPGNAALGAVDDIALTAEVAVQLAGLLVAAGIDLDLAPSVDVNSNPDNPVIGVRSFGADPALVARHAVAFVQGLQSTGVAACAKHFPGHGDTAVDSHLALPRVDADAATLHARELVPFRAVIDAGVASIMTSHVLLPAFDDRPATTSHRILTGLLRDELGFDGVIVSDALDMRGISAAAGIPAAAVASLSAGADLLCLGPDQGEADLEAVARAVEGALSTGALSIERLTDAADRVARLRPDGRRSDSGSPAGGRAAVAALRVSGAAIVPMRSAQVVTFDPPAGIAAGRVPWGVAAPMARLDPTTTATTVRAGDALPDVAANGPVVVVVRDAHRHAWQREALDRLHRVCPDLVVVDMGWPGPDPLPAATVITTFGASRASGQAAADLLLGRTHG
jgi:beta-N-acetylhexosaminidase